MSTKPPSKPDQPYLLVAQIMALALAALLVMVAMGRLAHDGVPVPRLGYLSCLASVAALYLVVICCRRNRP